MDLFIVIVVFALVAVIAAAAGAWWGAGMLSLAFALWGAVLLTSHLSGPFPFFGLLYVLAAMAEFVSACELLNARAIPAGEVRAWRAGSATLGAIGSIAGIAMLLYLVAAMISAILI